MRLRSNNLNEHFLSRHQLQLPRVVPNEYEHISRKIRPIGLFKDYFVKTRDRFRSFIHVKTSVILGIIISLNN